MLRIGFHSHFLFLLSTLTLCLLFFPSAALAQLTFSSPALLNSNGTIDTGTDSDPDIVTDSAGNWVAVWHSDENLGGTAGTDWDLFFSRSTDAGVTWSAPALLNSNGTIDTGRDASPELITDGSGNWVAVWRSPENLGGTAGTDWDNFFSRSTDAGATWTATALLNTNGTTDIGQELFPKLAADSSGNWVAVWQSAEDLGGLAGTDYDIFVSRSTDGGGTWTAPAILNTNATTDLNSDSSPSIVTDGSGNWIAAWDSKENLGGTAGTDFDIFVSRSTDAGATWTAPALLNSNASTDTGADRVPAIVTDGTGKWVTVWHSTENLGGTAGTDNDIFVSTATLAPIVGLPVSGDWLLGVLALTLLGIGWFVLRRSTTS